MPILSVSEASITEEDERVVKEGVPQLYPHTA